MAEPGSLKGVSLEDAMTGATATPPQALEVEDGGGAPPAAQDDGSSQSGSLIGIEGETAGSAKASVELSVDPAQVVARFGDKDITAAELSERYGQVEELTHFQEQAMPYVEFVENNRSVLQALASGDPATQREALAAVARQFGIQMDDPAASSANRDASGRFAKAPQVASGLIDLDAYEEGSEAYDLAQAFNAQAQKTSALEKQMQDFLGNISSQMESQKTKSQIEKIAEEWSGAGLMNLRASDAESLVGKPMTPEIAMKIVHFEDILRHNNQVARKSATQVSDPAPVREGAVRSLKGVSLEDAMRM